MSTPDIRPLELLTLWSDLDDAYHGKNGYGGDVAELYAYRFDVHSPYINGLGARATDDDALGIAVAMAADRARRLFDLLRLFAKQRDCRITVDGRKLGRWLLAPTFDHRVHVRIRAKGSTP